MKKNYLFKLLIFVVTALPFSCHNSTSDDIKPPCFGQNSSDSFSIDVPDQNNVVIANFKLSQATEVYPNKCGVDSYGETSLTITNATSNSISFTYVVEAAIGPIDWQYKDIANISPNATINIGVISSNELSLRAGILYIRISGLQIH